MCSRMVACGGVWCGARERARERVCAEIGDPTAYPWVGKPPHFTWDSQVTSWKQLSEWERLGGHTLHWAISTACQQHYQLDVLMGTCSLTADPSFKSFIPDGQETPRDSRVLLQLYECKEQEEPLSLLRKLCKSTKWVAIIHTRQW